MLREAGVDFVIRDTLLSSLAIATELLQNLGLPVDEAERIVARFKVHDADTLQRQAAVFHDDEAFRQETLSAAEELKQLFASDTTAEDG